MNTDDLVKIEYYRRWLRPDWRRLLHPDCERGLTPEQIKAQRHDFMLRDLAFETPRERRLRKEAEERAQVEQERLETEHRADIERKALKLKADLAWLRVELSMVGMALRAKANFNPDQPRDELGRWTDSGATDGSVAAANAAASGDGLPPHDHNNPPVRVPPERPEESRDRTRIIRVVSRSLALIAPAAARLSVIGTIISGAAWLREYRDEILTNLDPPKTLQELHDTVGIPRSGTQRHHIVEQGSAEQDGFSRSEIDAPDNLMRIPKQKHQQISDWYSRRNFADARFDGLSPREWLRNRTWEERRELGLEVLEKFGVLKR